MKLLRKIGRWDMIALMLNATIGGGIYGLGSQVFAKSGSFSLFAMLICAVVITLIILCFAEVGSRFNETGGPLVYAHEAFGPFAGFMTGWLSLVLRIIGIAAISNICVSYLGFFLPFAQSTSGRSVMVVLLILGLCFVNFLGIKQTILLNNIFTVGKIGTLVFFVAVGIFFIKKENFNFNEPVSFDNFSASVLLMVYAFSGFSGAVTTAGEMKDPQKDIPFSLLTVQVFKVILYMLIQVVCIGTLPSLAQTDKPLADAASNFLPGWGGTAITIGALISFTGTLNGGVLVTSRTAYGMAEKKVLPSFLGKVHDKFRTPYISLLFVCGILLMLTLTNSLFFLLTVNALGTLALYIISCASLIKLRKKKNIPAAAFILPAGNIIAMLGILFCLLIMIGSTQQQVLYILGILGAGVIVYGVFILGKQKLAIQPEVKD